MEKKLLSPIILILVFFAGAAFFWFYFSKSNPQVTKPTSKSPPQKNHSQWLQIIEEQETGLCQKEFVEGVPKERLLKQYSTENGWLTLVLCNTYAYQESFIVVYTDEKESHKVVSFTTFINPNETYEDNAPIGLEYDPQTQTFVTYVKGRGAADCGSIGEYRFDEMNKTADLVEYQLQECDQPLQTPWPQVFP